MTGSQTVRRKRECPGKRAHRRFWRGTTRERHAARRHDHGGGAARGHAKLDLPGHLGGHNSVYTAFSFQDEMRRPLYWYANGVAPTETPAMSLASAPVYSNGDRTVTITLKNNYKWSDGLPLTSADALFFSTKRGRQSRRTRPTGRATRRTSGCPTR